RLPQVFRILSFYSIYQSLNLVFLIDILDLLFDFFGDGRNLTDIVKQTFNVKLCASADNGAWGRSIFQEILNVFDKDTGTDFFRYRLFIHPDMWYTFTLFY